MKILLQKSDVKKKKIPVYDFKNMSFDETTEALKNMAIDLGRKTNSVELVHKHR